MNKSRGTQAMLLAARDSDLSSPTRQQSQSRRTGRCDIQKMEAETMKSILLVIHDDSRQGARLRPAIDAVRAVDGHLTCRRH